jgi:hypothetical protein
VLQLGGGRTDAFVVAKLRMSPLLVTESLATFNLTLYASSFVDEARRLLYIVTSGGQIVRRAVHAL